MEKARKITLKQNTSLKIEPENKKREFDISFLQFKQKPYNLVSM